MNRHIPDSARYARQLALPEMGAEGQARLACGRVLIVGAGGLGSPAALYLAAAGVGTLGIVDGDAVDASNLQRQILHGTGDVGRAKVASAVARLRELNPDVAVQAVAQRLMRDNGAALLRGYDFVIDATDNFETKFLIADLCHPLGIPYSHAGIARFCGQSLTVLPGRSACVRCIFERPPPPDSGPPQGPLGAVPGVIGSVQAAEAIKYLLGIGTLLNDRLFVYDALALTARVVRVARRETCELCGIPERLRRPLPSRDGQST